MTATAELFDSTNLVDFTGASLCGPWLVLSGKDPRFDARSSAEYSDPIGVVLRCRVVEISRAPLFREHWSFEREVFGVVPDDLRWKFDFFLYPRPMSSVELVNKNLATVSGSDTVDITLLFNNKRTKCLFFNVLHPFDLRYQSVSIATLEKSDLEISFYSRRRGKTLLPENFRSQRC